MGVASKLLFYFVIASEDYYESDFRHSQLFDFYNNSLLMMCFVYKIKPTAIVFPITDELPSALADS